MAYPGPLPPLTRGDYGGRHVPFPTPSPSLGEALSRRPLPPVDGSGGQNSSHRQLPPLLERRGEGGGGFPKQLPPLTVTRRDAGAVIPSDSLPHRALGGSGFPLQPYSLPSSSSSLDRHGGRVFADHSLLPERPGTAVGALHSPTSFGGLARPGTAATLGQSSFGRHGGGDMVSNVSPSGRHGSSVVPGQAVSPLGRSGGSPALPIQSPPERQLQAAGFASQPPSSLGRHSSGSNAFASLSPSGRHGLGFPSTQFSTSRDRTPGVDPRAVNRSPPGVAVPSPSLVMSPGDVVVGGAFRGQSPPGQAYAGSFSLSQSPSARRDMVAPSPGQLGSPSSRRDGGFSPFQSSPLRGDGHRQFPQAPGGPSGSGLDGSVEGRRHVVVVGRAGTVVHHFSPPRQDSQPAEFEPSRVQSETLRAV